MVRYFLLLKKAPKSHFEPIYFALSVWFTYHPVEGAQHQKNKNWWIKHKWTRRTQNISKNQNLYPHQSKITLPSLLWDTRPCNRIYYKCTALWKAMFNQTTNQINTIHTSNPAYTPFVLEKDLKNSPCIYILCLSIF